MVTLSNKILSLVLNQSMRSFTYFKINDLGEAFSPKTVWLISAWQRGAQCSLTSSRHQTSRANGARFNLLISKAPWIEPADLRKIGYVMGLRGIRVGAILESLLLATRTCSALRGIRLLFSKHVRKASNLISW